MVINNAGLAANSWNSSKSFGDKVELEYCREFLEKTFGHIMISLENIPYSKENMDIQKNYGDYKMVLKPNKVYWVESKGRARDTNDLCVEVHKVDGKWRLRHPHTDLLYYWTPNHKPLLIDIPMLRVLIYENDGWQRYVKENRQGDGSCMFIPRHILIPKYMEMMGMSA